MGRISRGGIQRVVQHGPTLPQSTPSCLCLVWRPWHRGVRALARRFPAVPLRHAAAPARAFARPDRQRRRLHAGELPLGDALGTAAQPQHGPARPWHVSDRGPVARRDQNQRLPDRSRYLRHQGRSEPRLSPGGGSGAPDDGACHGGACPADAPDRRELRFNRPANASGANLVRSAPRRHRSRRTGNDPLDPTDQCLQNGGEMEDQWRR